MENKGEQLSPSIQDLYPISKILHLQESPSNNEKNIPGDIQAVTF